MRGALVLLVALACAAACSGGSGEPMLREPPVWRPIPSVTPGSAFPESQVYPLHGPPAVCTAGWAARHPQVPLDAEQKAELRLAYRLQPTDTVAQWDHLIPSELGGDDSTSNIWPQPHKNDARRKDRLERRLYRAVCITRTLDLLSAQNEITQFWHFW